jgi:SAM-dependent methyltransferase
MAKHKHLYEAYHESKGHLRSSAFHGPRAQCAYPDARRVLDFGCGNGHAVRQMRSRGYDWYGVELSETAFKEHLGEPYFYQGDLTQFDDRSFDLIYSTEVLEHIPEEEVDEVVTHMCRVSRNYLFLTISLRPSSNNNAYHCTLRPRTWWEQKFVANGFEVDREAVTAFQKKTLKSTSDILSRWAKLGPVPASFAANPPYRLFGETQFWFFAFCRGHAKKRSFMQKARLVRHRQLLVPLIRGVLKLDERRP